MELAGWTGSVRATADSPKPPVMSDTVVTMIHGTAEMRNGKMKVTATEGSTFKFAVSTRAVSSIEVLSGSVTISRSSGTIETLAPGTTYYLPKP